MDENSCENETSESVDGQKAKKAENALGLDDIRINVGGKNERQETSGRCGSSMDASVSGPSTVLPLEENRNKNNTIDGGRAAMMQMFASTENAQNESMESLAMEETEPKIEETPLVSQAFPLKECQSRNQDVEEMRRQRSVKLRIEETAEDHLLNLIKDEENSLDEVSVLSSNEEEQQENREEQLQVRLAPDVQEQMSMREGNVGPPPSYSFVMKQKKRLKPLPSPDSEIISRPPPPTYSTSRGIYLTPEERICNFPSFAEPIWRSHSQPALCPRCGIIILTTTHAHDSIATHVAVVTLCLFGCWPCCLLPYCMNVCKNTYHHCPLCQTFLGLYRPW